MPCVFRPRGQVLAAIAWLFVGTACNAHRKAADQTAVLAHVPVRLEGTYRIAKAQSEEMDGHVTTKWTPNELDVRCAPSDNDAIDIFVERGVLGHRSDQPPRVPLDASVPAFVDVVRTAAYRWRFTQHDGQVTADDRLPDWMTDAIVRWMFMIPQPPPATTSVGGTWSGRRALPKGSANAGESYDLAYTLSKFDGCADPEAGRCASIAFIATSVPDVPAFARFGTTVRGTARISLEGLLVEIRATVRYADSVTVEEWTISRR